MFNLRLFYSLYLHLFTLVIALVGTVVVVVAVVVVVVSIRLGAKFDILSVHVSIISSSILLHSKPPTNINTRIHTYRVVESVKHLVR